MVGTKPTSPTNPALVDKWSTYDYIVPGIFVMENRCYPRGMAEKTGFGTATANPMTYRVEQQAVTPIDDNRTRYFFATGFDAALPEKLLEPIFETVMAAFAEDRAIIEAQQSIWSLTPEDKPMAFIAHGKGASHVPPRARD